MRTGFLPLLLLARGCAALPTAAPAGALGVAQLSLRLSDAEREQRRLSPETLRDAAALLDDHGVVRICSALDAELADACAAAVERNFAACTSQLAARGVATDGPFAYKEICHRAPLRYDMQLGENARHPLGEEAAALREGVWQPLLTRVLGRDMRHNFDGVVLAEPGAAPQQPHMDGGHLFHATHGFSLDLPVHIVNVFLPLIDTPLRVGPTEFWPGSHKAHMAMEVEDIAPVALEVDRGDVIIFDYRTYHRGMPNQSGERRPMLYQTYSRAWFRDGHNFPEVSLFAEEDGAAEGDLYADPSKGFSG